MLSSRATRSRLWNRSEKPSSDGAQIIDGGGRTLMPGLIDAHWHAMMASLPLLQLLTADVGFITLAAAAEAERTLMRGFTSIRDLAGPSFSLKRAIDSGLNAGPRIWPSGAMISQTSGHGDCPAAVRSSRRLRCSAQPWRRDRGWRDRRRRRSGAQACSRAVDAGRSQLKLAAGGGVASNYDPIDASQYTEAEFRAAVELG